MKSCAFRLALRSRRSLRSPLASPPGYQMPRTHVGPHITSKGLTIDGGYLAIAGSSTRIGLFHLTFTNGVFMSPHS